MKTLSSEVLSYEFTRHVPVRLSIASGETIQVDTQDAFSGKIRSNDDRKPPQDRYDSNPLTGPIFVEGAEPGDSIAVRIESIEPTIGQCMTRTPWPEAMAEWLGPDCPHGVHVCPIRDGQVYWSDHVTIPYQPMFGCIGTAPAVGSPTSEPVGVYGGNMDIIETTIGNTIHLPVFVPGAFLYLGDVHAAMGHGELSSTGLEMPARSVIRVDVVKKKIPSPRIESDTFIMAIATGRPMERAFAQASAYLIQWMEADFGCDKWKAFDLLTHVSRASIGYYHFGTVGVRIDRRYLEALGGKQRSPD